MSICTALLTMNKRLMTIRITPKSGNYSIIRTLIRTANLRFLKRIHSVQTLSRSFAPCKLKEIDGAKTTKSLMRITVRRCS